MKKAISYVRFSTPEQSKGASLARQTEAAQNICERNNWILLDTKFHDLGVSGFTGANVAAGALGKFIRAVQDGEIEAGTVLIVENLDRLSRDAVPEAFTQFVKILNLGIEIFTAHDNAHYTKETFSQNTSSILMSILLMARAYEESATKSLRIRDSYKRRKATKKIWSSRHPHWLKQVGDEFEIIEEKADVIRKIFELYLSGYGSVLISKFMNEHYPREKLTVNSADKWSASLILIYLKNQAVIGTLVPDDESQPWTMNYYPAIIKTEDFYRVNEKLGQKRTTSDAVGTIITSKCSLCGSTMKFIGAIDERRDGRFLRCESTISGNCTSETVRYKEFEDAFISNLMNAEVGEDVPVPDKSVKEIELETINKQISNLGAAISLLNDPNQIPILVNQLSALQQQANLITKEIQTFVPKSSISKKFQRLKDAHRKLELDRSNNEFRMNFRSCANEVVDRVEIDPKFVEFGQTTGRIFRIIGVFKGSEKEIICFVPMKKMRNYTKKTISNPK